MDIELRKVKEVRQRMREAEEQKKLSESRAKAEKCLNCEGVFTPDHQAVLRGEMVSSVDQFLSQVVVSN